MKKIVFGISLVMLMFLLVGCTSTNDGQRDNPSTTLQPEPSSGETSTTEQIQNTSEQDFDYILEHLKSFSTEELIEYFLQSDGAYADGILDELSIRFEENIKETLGIIASKSSGENRQLIAFLIGSTLRIREVPEEDMDKIYAAKELNLTDAEKAILAEVINAFETES